MAAPRQLDPSENSSHAFEIFKAHEIAAIKAQPRYLIYQEVIDKLFLMTNHWIHNKQGGWCSALIQTLPSWRNGREIEFTDNLKLESPEESFVRRGLVRYLETANKLQKCKTGQMEVRLLPTANKFIQKFVNVYQTFWEECFYQTFFLFLVRLSKKDFGHDRADRQNLSVCFVTV